MLSSVGLTYSYFSLFRLLICTRVILKEIT
nr:MAG TPA: hypothetical protein [Caudoviricetes sp.]